MELFARCAFISKQFFRVLDEKLAAGLAKRTSAGPAVQRAADREDADVRVGGQFIVGRAYFHAGGNYDALSPAEMKHSVGEPLARRACDQIDQPVKMGG